MEILCLLMDRRPPETGVYEWKKFTKENKSGGGTKFAQFRVNR